MKIYDALRPYTAVPPNRWARGLDPDFTLYIIAGLRRIFQWQLPVQVWLISGRRSMQQQAALHRTARVAARPGCSQHEFGYAVDLRVVIEKQGRETLAVLLQTFGIPYDPDPGRIESLVLSTAFDGLLFGRGEEDPNHWAFYPDDQWKAALNASGRECGRILPRPYVDPPTLIPYNRNYRPWISEP